jgi:translation elongation factor EF-Tu-like GTPase
MGGSLRFTDTSANGLGFAIREGGRTVGAGTVTALLD